MAQIVDLQNSSDFQALNVQVVSIALDSITEMAPEAQALSITEIDIKVILSQTAPNRLLPIGRPVHTAVKNCRIELQGI